MDSKKLCPNCMNELNGNKCPHCGYDINDPQVNSHALKTYSILNGKYLIGNVIGEGGFGITYIGFDLNLEIKIAVKEFYPNGFVTRESEVTNTVTEYTTNDPERYQKWKDSFVREARNLAKFSNLPGIVHVRDFFQENNTAYIIMEYVEGETLKKYLKTRGSVLTAAETLDMMKHVIKSLAKVHQAGIIHRDISPDNIMIQDGGNIKLIDFGAAREFEADNERSMSVLLKPGYAPEEQYRTRGNQGPWTDVYALCATIYRCITGKKPVESMERMREDSLLKPSALGIRISPETEAALMAGLAVYAENRIQNMDALYEALYKGNAQAVNAGNINTHKSGDNIKPEKNIQKNAVAGGFSDKFRFIMSDRKIVITLVSSTVLIIAIIAVIASNMGNNKNDIPDEPEPVVSTADVQQAEESDPEPVQPFEPVTEPQPSEETDPGQQEVTFEENTDETEEPSWRNAYREVLDKPDLLSKAEGFDTDYLEEYFGDPYVINEYFICDVDDNGIPELFVKGVLNFVLTYEDGLKCIVENAARINIYTKEIIEEGHWHGAGGSATNEWTIYEIRDGGVERIYMDYMPWMGNDGYYLYDSYCSREEYDNCYIQHILPSVSIERYDLYERNNYDGLYNEQKVESLNKDEINAVKYSVYVTADDGFVNYRTGPGTDYDIIEEVWDGELLYVVDENEGGRWLKVLRPGKTGWAAASQVTRCE